MGLGAKRWRGWVLTAVGLPGLVATMGTPVEARLLEPPAPAAVPTAAQDPAATDDVLDRARTLRRAGQSAEASRVLRAQLSEHLEEGDFVGLLGLCLLDIGAVEEARTLWLEQASVSSASFRMEILRGRLAQADHDLDAADEAYRDATRMNERAVEAWVLWIRAQMTAQRFGKALKLAERLEAVNPEIGRPLSAEILRMQGDGYRRLGASTIELAADKYVDALGKTPDDDALADLVLETQLSAVRLEAVAELIEERFQDEAHARQRHYWSGRRLAAGQDAVGARSAFEAALVLDASDADSALWLAKLSIDDGQLDAARAWLERCSSAGLATAQTELLMGEVLMGLGQLEAAETHLRAASARDPGLTKALYLLGRLLLRTGQTAEAHEVLARFAELTRPPPVEGAGHGEPDDVDG